MPSSLKIFILKSGWGSSQVQAPLWKRMIYLGVSQPAGFSCSLHCLIGKWCKPRKRVHAAVQRWPHRRRSRKGISDWRSPPRLSDPLTEKCLDVQQQSHPARNPKISGCFALISHTGSFGEAPTYTLLQQTAAFVGIPIGAEPGWWRRAERPKATRLPVREVFDKC